MTGYQPAFNARLIAEVKKYPCLYNHSKRGSGDTTERMRIWDSIAIAVDPNCSGEFAKKRWLQLRDRYRKELKVAIRQNFTSPVRWCYFAHLSWLDPYLKDNLALSGVDSIDFKDFKGMELGLFAHLKAELDEGIGEDSRESPMFESSLERVLAATHRQESLSPALENDDSGPQSVGTSGDDDPTTDHHLGMNDPLSDESSPKESPSDPMRDVLQSVLQSGSSSLPTFSIKEQIVARQNQLQKNVLQAATAALDWTNDEDLLYGRIIGLRMKSMDSKKRKRVRAQIMALLEDSDDEELSSPPKVFHEETETFIPAEDKESPVEE